MQDTNDIFTFSLVYLSFFLFPEQKVLKRKLFSLLDNIPSQDIEAALRLLEKKELILHTDGHFVINSERDFSFLSVDFDRDAEIRNIQNTLLEAQEKSKLMHSKRDEVVFHSSLLTVRKEDFLKLLPKIKTDLRTMHAELENENPDTLIRFNIQVYPTLTKTKAR